MGPGHRHFNGGRKTWFKGVILVGTTFKAALNSSAKSATMFCVTIQCFAETKHSTKGYDAECLLQLLDVQIKEEKFMAI